MNGNGVVLIVDDHAPLACSLVSLFSASGFDAHAVHSGSEALAFVRSHAAVALIRSTCPCRICPELTCCGPYVSPEAGTPIRCPS